MAERTAWSAAAEARTTPGPKATRTLVLLSLAELLAMSLWFTGTAVLPQLSRQWHAGYALSSWLTMAVQLGFVAGALGSAILNLNDIFPAWAIFAASAVMAAAANAVFAGVAGSHIALALAMRIMTGACLAGVYPTGMKILAGWYREGRGIALGVMVGALTIGSALPHGVLALGESLPWRAVVQVSSVLACAGAVLVAAGVRDGPYVGRLPAFDWRQIGQAFREPGLRLANFGYLGHMWELYGLWTWMALLLGAASPAATHAKTERDAFLTIAIGCVGCVAAGKLSDRLAARFAGAQRVAGRAMVAGGAMAASGACCLGAALAFGRPALLTAIALVWGVVVIADSAQFSAAISELADPRYVGTALTAQTAFGFLLTVVSIRAVAAVAGAWGWRWAAASLAMGPALGALSMWRLRRLVA